MQHFINEVYIYIKEFYKQSCKLQLLNNSMLNRHGNKPFVITICFSFIVVSQTFIIILTICWTNNHTNTLVLKYIFYWKKVVVLIGKNNNRKVLECLISLLKRKY